MLSNYRNLDATGCLLYMRTRKLVFKDAYQIILYTGMGNFKNGEMRTGNLNSDVYRLSNYRTGLTELAVLRMCMLCKTAQAFERQFVCGLFY